MKVKLYGIPNCNTVKKALSWLEEHQIDFVFHDFKKLGIAETKLRDWAFVQGWELLMNRKGLTWKQLDLQIKESINSENAAVALMQEKTSLIKRPVLEANGKIFFGFDEVAYSNIFF
jgi:arsenate reductase